MASHDPTDDYCSKLACLYVFCSLTQKKNAACFLRLVFYSGFKNIRHAFTSNKSVSNFIPLISFPNLIIRPQKREESLLSGNEEKTRGSAREDGNALTGRSEGARSRTRWISQFSPLLPCTLIALAPLRSNW